MKKKNIVFILVFMLLITIISHVTAIVGDEEDPEIVDDVGDTLIKGLDIVSAWFSDDGENLTVTIKLEEIKLEPILWTHFTVLWKYNNTDYHIGCSIRGFGDSRTYDYHYGYRFPWLWFPLKHFWSYNDADGSINKENCTISIKCPLSFLDNPDAGEKLTETHAMTHFLGLRNPIILTIALDHAPKRGTYGKDYVIGS